MSSEIVILTVSQQKRLGEIKAEYDALLDRSLFLLEKIQDNNRNMRFKLADKQAKEYNQVKREMIALDTERTEFYLVARVVMAKNILDEKTI